MTEREKAMIKIAGVFSPIKFLKLNEIELEIFHKCNSKTHANFKISLTKF
jgi:hypothetical protein